MFHQLKAVTNKYNNHSVWSFQVNMRASCLNSNDVFILKKEKAYFIWCGRGATGDEREMAKQVAKRISKDDYTVVFEGEFFFVVVKIVEGGDYYFGGFGAC